MKGKDKIPSRWKEFSSKSLDTKAVDCLLMMGVNLVSQLAHEWGGHQNRSC